MNSRRLKAGMGSPHPVQPVSRTLSLARRDWLVLGATLKRSEPRCWAAPRRPIQGAHAWPPSTAKFQLSALAQYLRCRRVGRHSLLQLRVPNPDASFGVRMSPSAECGHRHVRRRAAQEAKKTTRPAFVGKQVSLAPRPSVLAVWALISGSSSAQSSDVRAKRRMIVLNMGSCTVLAASLAETHLTSRCR